jgi:hypothetical protein
LRVTQNTHSALQTSGVKRSFEARAFPAANPCPWMGIPFAQTPQTTRITMFGNIHNW